LDVLQVEKGDSSCITKENGQNRWLFSTQGPIR
jgi:hypothetical protein